MNSPIPDITLRLDAEGVIEEVQLSASLGSRTAEGWIGRLWSETVPVESGGKVQRMIEDARRNGYAPFRQITQVFEEGAELPFEFTAIQSSGGAGLIAVGKSLQIVADLQSRLMSAQRAMEQEYWKLRHIETRYRMLFDASGEAVVLLRASDLEIVEINPAARNLLGLVGAGQSFLEIIPLGERDAVRTVFQRAGEHGHAPAVLIRAEPAGAQWLIKATLITAEAGPQYMTRIAEVGTRTQPFDAGSEWLVGNFVERLPDGFVVIGTDGRIVQSNGAFVEMVQAGTATSVIGADIRQWLGRPGADLRILLEHVRAHRVVGLFPTQINGEHGIARDVEISATGDRNEDPERIALVVRDVGQRLVAPQSGLHPAAPAPVDMDSIGRRSLRELIDEAVGSVERRSIRSALEMTHGNRSAAAELLGLSRQSLYSKMSRYKLEDTRPTARRSARSGDPVDT